MNGQIEGWRNLAFASGVYNLSQQRGSRLARFCRPETFTGKAEFFDRLGLAEAQEKQGRNPTTPNLDIPHSRRMVVTKTYDWGTLVDSDDKVQNIHDPESQYAVAAQNALGRKMDDVVIAGALGIARYGEDGSSSQYLGNTRKVCSVAAGVLARPNVALLRHAKYLFDSQEVEGTRVLAHNSSFLLAMLSQTEVTSSDYNTIRALVNGELNTFMGFTFVQLERLPLASVHDNDDFHFDTTSGLYSGGGTDLLGTEESALAFIGDGVILGKNPRAVTRVGERADKSYSNQVYAAMNFGAVRMEEVKVAQLIYKVL